MADLSSKVRRSDGCGYLLVICVITCLLFVANGMMATILFVRVRSFLPDWASRPRYVQLFLMSVPVALIFVEWYLYDWFVRHRRSTTQSGNPSGSEKTIS